MVTRLLNLDEIPEPADAADALAIAICHLHTAATQERQAQPLLGSTRESRCAEPYASQAKRKVAVVRVNTLPASPHS